MDSFNLLLLRDRFCANVRFTGERVEANKGKELVQSHRGLMTQPGPEP